MPTTTVRQIDLMLVGSLGKEVLSNDGMENLALGISGATTIPLAATDYTLTTDNQGQAMHMILVLTGTLTANVNLLVPAEGRVFVVDNRTTGAFTVTVKTATGSGFAVPQADRTFLYCDGTNVYPVGTAGGAGGEGAPTDASYLVSAAHSLLTGERVVTDTATVTWNHATVGQSAAQVPDGAVTYAKLQAISASPRLLGRSSAGAGVVEEVSIGSGLTMSGGALSAPAPAPASETVAGIVELNTPAETVTGTDTTRATHAAGVTAALDARVPAGTPLSVTRYGAGGTTLEATPGMGTTATGWLGIGLSTPTTALQVQGDTVQAGQVTALSYHDANGNAALILRRGRGTMAAPGMVTLGDYTGALTFQGWARNGADTADIFVQTALMRSEVDSVDAQGRIGGRLAFFTNPAASGGVVERLRIDGQGNLTTTGANITTGLQAGLALKIGARPSATLPDAVETWVEDFESGATAASLLVWPEGAIAPTTIGNGLLHKMVGRSLTTHSVSSPYVLTAEMSGKLLISNNATELGVIQLPLCPNPSSWGLYYVIGNYQASPRGTRIVPGTGGRIQLASTAGAANQAIQSQVSGDYMTIVCINNGFWHIMSPAQGWVFV